MYSFSANFSSNVLGQKCSGNVPTREHQTNKKNHKDHFGYDLCE